MSNRNMSNGNMVDAASMLHGVGGVDASEGARRATGEASTPPTPGAPPPPSPSPASKSRWSRSRKRDVVLRLLRGESVEALSRELGVEIYRLERWRERALVGMEDALRERSGDPVEHELDTAKKRIGELSMEVELLRERCRRSHPFGSRTSRP